MFESIVSGGVAYELARPVDLYGLWYSKSLAIRFSDAMLRMLPILAVAMLLPAPYGLMLPTDILTLIATLLSVFLATFVVCATAMFVYILTFYTMQPRGLRVIYFSIVDLLSGSLLPLPFFPEPLRRWLEKTPFAASTDIPLRIYSSNIPAAEALENIALQLFWLAVMFLLGKLAMSRALKRTVIQGG